MEKVDSKPLKSYRDLKVWQKAMDLAELAYKISELLPRKEQYGLIAQIQRSAVSIPANISEGYGRLHRGDYVHHLSIANGSLKELETHFELCVRLGYVGRDQIRAAVDVADEIGRMLLSLIRKLGLARQ